MNDKASMSHPERKKQLVDILQQELRPSGFRKDGSNWRLDTPETIVVVNLQKSRWSDAYDINLGTLVKSLPDLPDRPRNHARPSIVDCHYCVRFDDLFHEKQQGEESVSPRQAMVRALLDFNALKIDTAKRTIGLQSIFRERMLPFLELCRTERGIEKIVKEWGDPSYLMHWQLRDRLGLKLPPAPC